MNDIHVLYYYGVSFRKKAFPAWKLWAVDHAGTLGD
jgi:hypothetical protein